MSPAAAIVMLRLIRSAEVRLFTQLIRALELRMTVLSQMEFLRIHLSSIIQSLQLPQVVFGFLCFSRCFLKQHATDVLLALGVYYDDDNELMMMMLMTKKLPWRYECYCF